ncbi:MAG: CRISPR-associated ring nuclease Csm6 [Methylomonas sp.]|jgi:CRISPR-associated protein (TIGR02584 family)|uniref:CRISPR-associated ring nuclease Csm6 n=1 Tax=Methylomonas sp. TaxID=418 RepID=UPI0025F0A374|nr:CRISPR-associated ring nuclease Csm6 [Methylomonas sp.]MCK9606989.1 CRISPR-associated ring nuclease Csm6 [Methylomonas sp.]
MNKQIILLAVTGLTPQVVTETLYALYGQGDDLPTAIHILTTAEGRQRAKLTLINDGWLGRFYADYRLSAAEFSEQHIHILQQANGEALNDIRSQSDNQSMADGITEWIRTFTADPDTSLHVSIAGGRKTMGFYAGYALSLYGRNQDRLSHVLVSADYESHPQFYYPTPYSQVIYANDASRKPLDTQQAEVMLADIPFVRLRHGLDQALLEGKSSFSQSVANAQQSVGPAHLTVDLSKRTLTAHDIALKLIPADLAFYLWLLQRQADGQPAPQCPSDGAADLEYAKEYLAQYRRVHGALGGTDRTVETLKNGMSKSFFEQRKSRINKKLQQTLRHAAQAYLIGARGKRPKTSYRIGLTIEQIEYL